jgi:hypothetical protein
MMQPAVGGLTSGSAEPHNVPLLGTSSRGASIDPLLEQFSGAEGTGGPKEI